MPAVLWGVAFANIVRGVPIDADKEFTGNLFTLLNPFGLLGGLVTLPLFLTHGAMFIALKTDGEIRHRARALAWKIGARGRGARGGLPGAGPRSQTGQRRRRPCVFVVAALLRSWRGLAAAYAGREGWAFAGTFVTIALAVAGLFVALFPDVMPSSTDAAFSPDDDQRGRDGVHAEDHDVGGRDLHAAGARLPGLDLLGLPQADRACTTSPTAELARGPMRPLDPASSTTCARPRAARASSSSATVARRAAGDRPGVRASAALVVAVVDRWLGR